MQRRNTRIYKANRIIIAYKLHYNPILACDIRHLGVLRKIYVSFCKIYISFCDAITFRFADYKKSEKNWTEGGFYYWHEWAICLGPNGNKITFEKTGLYEATDCLTRTSEILFWLNNKEYFHGNCANITLNNLEVGSGSKFSGYKLPIRLVKKIG